MYTIFLVWIDREATKVRADAHLQKSLPGQGISLKTTQAFLKIFKELYSAISKPVCESSYFQCIKFSKFFVRFVMLLIAPALFDLIIAHYIKKQVRAGGRSFQLVGLAEQWSRNVF